MLCETYAEILGKDADAMEILFVSHDRNLVSRSALRQLRRPRSHIRMQFLHGLLSPRRISRNTEQRCLGRPSPLRVLGGANSSASSV